MCGRCGTHGKMELFFPFCPPLTSAVPMEITIGFNLKELPASLSLSALVLSGELHVLGTSFLQLD